jgi:siroheme synthase-like protein
VADPELVYPVALRLTGRPVLVVGGGDVASRKVSDLLAVGADVTVVAPEFVPELESAGCVLERRAYRRGEVAGYGLVVAATDDEAVNQAVHDDAEAAGAWVNVADQPERCSVLLPAVARAGRVVVAVSTGGASPALAGWLRDRLRSAMPTGLDVIAEQLARERVAQQSAGRSTESVAWRERIEALVAEHGVEGTARAGES